MYRFLNKYIIFFMLMLLGFSYSDSSVLPENDWSKEKLKGKVKKMTLTRHEYGYSGDEKTVRKIVTLFNSEGYKTMETHYLNGRENYTLYFKYNKEGLLTESNDYTGIEYIHEYERDENGNLKETIRNKNKEDYQSLKKILYDKNGRKIRDQLYDQSIYEKKNIKLSKNDTYIKDKKRGLFSLIGDYEYTYDEKGEVKEIKQHVYSSGDLKVSYEYNQDGSYLKIRDIPGQRWIIYYDKEGNEKEYVWITQPSSQMDPIVQLHLIYTDIKKDKYKNLTEQTEIRIEEEKGKAIEKDIYRKIIIEYEYY